MLRELSVKNVALIDSLEVEFSRGLNILSGETGAGKSIIIDSLNFVLGGRADKTLIRYGMSEAQVEAEFENICERTVAKLQEYEIDYSEGLIISRIMSMEGRNVCRINGVKVTTAVLREITNTLVDIYGQHENSILLNADNHIGIVDSYSKEIGDALSVYADVFKRYKATVSKLKELGSLTDVGAKMTKLNKQIAEIEKCKITPGEEKELASQLEIMESSEEIVEGVQKALDSLNDKNCGIDSVSYALKSLVDVKHFDVAIADSYERLSTILIDLEDIAGALARGKVACDFDQYEKQRVEERVNEIRECEEVYGNTEEDVLIKLSQLKMDYEKYSNSEFEVAELTRSLIKVRKELVEAANLLTAARKIGAEKFNKAVLCELNELGMGKTKFDTEIISESEDKASSKGVDKVQFMISPNPGQPLKPLSKIVSGGEMSRLMLAVKKITSDIDGVNVMVFDEIDTGISGRIADVVAKKLYDISCDKQVLAITHLPQLASMADNHYLIEKSSTDESTSTKLVLLDCDGMVSEVARLSGGEKTESGKKHAEDMKSIANEYKRLNRAQR